MAKRTSNHEIKRIIAVAVLKGRKALWHGEVSEVFAANSVEQLNEEFGVIDEENPNENVGVSFTGVKGWWKPCVNEKEEGLRGQPVKNKDGTINPNYISLPLICNVYGDGETIAQVSTSYN